MNRYGIRTEVVAADGVEGGAMLMVDADSAPRALALLLESPEATLALGALDHASLTVIVSLADPATYGIPRDEGVVR